MATTLTLGPAAVNLVGVRAGDRNLFGIALVEGETPVDLTGLTATAQARKSATDPDPAALTAVVEVIDAPGGRLTVRWPGAAVTAVLAGAATWAGVWDLQIGSTGADPVTLVAGTFTAETDVTRP
jgi:hypothetical protein